jgi:hypothetical protein
MFGELLGFNPRNDRSRGSFDRRWFACGRLRLGCLRVLWGTGTAGIPEHTTRPSA